MKRLGKPKIHTATTLKEGIKNLICKIFRTSARDHETPGDGYAEIVIEGSCDISHRMKVNNLKLTLGIKEKEK